MSEPKFQLSERVVHDGVPGVVVAFGDPLATGEHTYRVQDDPVTYPESKLLPATRTIEGVEVEANAPEFLTDEEREAAEAAKAEEKR